MLTLSAAARNDIADAIMALFHEKPVYALYITNGSPRLLVPVDLDREHLTPLDAPSDPAAQRVLFVNTDRVLYEMYLDVGKNGPEED
jgi:hypothetical protein